MERGIKKYLFKNGLKLEFEILDLAERLAHTGNAMVVPHRAQFYHILWIERGRGTHFVDFKPLPIADNTLLFVPSNCVNQYDAQGEYQGKSIVFTDRFFCKNQQDAHFLNSSMLFSDFYPTASFPVGTGNTDLKTVFEAMEMEYAREKDTAQYAILHNLLHIFLLQAEREMRKLGFSELKPGADLESLNRFKELMDENFRKVKNVSRYASLLSISEKQLHKATTSVLGKTPKQLIDERILLETKRLLVHTHLSVKEIAYELGYEEPTNFIKYFRKHTGITPSEFRDQN